MQGGSSTKQVDLQQLMDTVLTTEEERALVIIEREASADNVAAYAAKYQLGYRIAPDVTGDIFRLYGPRGIPTSIFVGPEAAPEFWRGTVAFSRELAEAAESSAFWVKITPTVVMLIGLWIAWSNYIRNPGAADRFVATFPSVYRFVSNKWYFDELYDFLFVRPSLWLGRLFWHGGDEGTECKEQD